MGKVIVLSICIAASGWFFWLYYVMVRDCYAEDRRARLREIAKRDAAKMLQNPIE
jgi:hypothetical protein